MNNAITNPVKGTGFAVVELFTSEGCSSCPAADKAVEELQKQYPDDVYVLAFHVDYWNRLGWVDSFSKAEYTARQNSYANQFKLESIYTPEVVVNGQIEFVGSDKAKLQAATKNGLAKVSTGSVELSAIAKSNSVIAVHYNQTLPGTDLHIALVQTEAETSVLRGENGGRKLHHINLVREFKTISNPSGDIDFILPVGVPPSQLTVVGYSQQKNGAITAVHQVNVKAA